ncbi:hypothetical protein HI113_08445 [Corallococcus exiguus]|uniref:hypothetical protein n=1 Tax=Corallococcus exiguus TaxID=83462 RepID=UPI001471A4D9|nr:hypothetical protein [Corallococcus exiguus]NNB85878.1 hypothetical protein [Corallococcus exiguus]NNB93932.1 hypothetical protein [Corallococcus exiguus]
MEFQIEFHAKRLDSLAPGTGSVARHGTPGTTTPDWAGVGNESFAVLVPEHASEDKVVLMAT